jgi:hypothetical protein
MNFILLFLSCLSASSNKTFHNFESNYAQLHNKQLILEKNEKILKIKNNFVYGAIIMSEYEPKNKKDSSINEEDEKAKLIISARIKNAKQLIGDLPFPVTEWPAVFSKQCPQFYNGL